MWPLNTLLSPLHPELPALFLCVKCTRLFDFLMLLSFFFFSKLLIVSAWWTPPKTELRSLHFHEALNDRGSVSPPCSFSILFTLITGLWLLATCLSTLLHCEHLEDRARVIFMSAVPEPAQCLAIKGCSMRIFCVCFSECLLKPSGSIVGVWGKDFIEYLWCVFRGDIWTQLGTTKMNLTNYLLYKYNQMPWNWHNFSTLMLRRSEI